MWPEKKREGLSDLTETMNPVSSNYGEYAPEEGERKIEGYQPPVLAKTGPVETYDCYRHAYSYYPPTGCHYSFGKVHSSRPFPYNTPHEFILTINCPDSSQSAIINASYDSALAITKPRFVNITDSDISYYSPEEPESMLKWRSLRGSVALFEVPTYY